jgi:hypothetical protein
MDKKQAGREAILALETELLLPWSPDVIRGIEVSINALHDHFDISRDDLALQVLRDKERELYVRSK